MSIERNYFMASGTKENKENNEPQKSQKVIITDFENTEYAKIMKNQKKKDLQELTKSQKNGIIFEGEKKEQNNESNS